MTYINIYLQLPHVFAKEHLK